MEPLNHKFEIDGVKLFIEEYDKEFFLYLDSKPFKNYYKSKKNLFNILLQTQINTINLKKKEYISIVDEKGKASELNNLEQKPPARELDNSQEESKSEEIVGKKKILG